MMDLSASILQNEQARQAIAGGVNSNVRLAGRSRPLWFSHGSGSKLFDVDGNEYVDYALGMGPAIFGHAPTFLTEAVAATLKLGQVFAGQHPLELKFANLLRDLIPSAELVRIGSTGSEMVQAALRVARAYTGRSKIVKFEGHYHGWFDSVLVSQTGTGHSPAEPVPFPQLIQTEGQSQAALVDTNVLPWNCSEALERYLTDFGPAVAAVIMEPVMCNTGVISPKPGYLESVRDLCNRHGVVFVMDEVVTGFRLRPGGAQALFDVRPDLSIYAKALGGGFPVAALAGKADIMSLIGSGRVNHSGTYNANLVSVAAGIATLERIGTHGEEIYRHIERVGTALMVGIREIAAHRKTNLKVTGYPAAFHTFFTDEPDTSDCFSYRKSDAERLGGFIEALIARGVRPIARGTWFVSAAHTNADVEVTLDAVDRALATF